MTTWVNIEHLRAQAGAEIITAKLLVLQSKRLMLKAAQRGLERDPDDSIRTQVDSLRDDIALAQFRYRESILQWGSPAHADYWLIAYSRLIDMGNTLSGKLRDAAEILPFPERYEVSADVEALEDIVKHWTSSMRLAMVAEVR